MRDRLLIKKIEISNCGGFEGDHSIELSSDNEKNFTVIIGLSGRGKSTIFQLVHWCLYGMHFDEKDEVTATEEGIINLSKLESLEEGDKVSGKVTLRIYNQNGEKYVLERTITAEKLSDDSRLKFDANNNSKIEAGIHTETSCKLKMKDKSGNDTWEKNDDIISSEIRRHLPQTLKDFFLFDGEKLVNFRTKSGSSILIRDGIEKISGLQVLDSLISDVAYTHKKIDSSLEGSTVSSKGLKNTVDTLKDEIEEKKKEQQENETLKANKSALLEQTIQQIASSSEGKRIEDQIKTQDDILKENKKNLRENEIKTHDFIFEKLPLLLISDTLHEAEQSFGVLERLNFIPPSITREALDKIFDNKRCICGIPFTEEDDAWEILNKIKKAVLDKDTTAGITQGRSIISQMIDGTNISTVKSKYDELLNLSSTLDRTKLEASAKREKLFGEQQNIKGVSGLDYDELIKLRKDLLSDVAGLTADIKSLEEDVLSKEGELEDKEKKYRNKLAYEGKYEKELAKLTILNAITKYTKKKRKEIVETLRGKTEEYTGKYFKSCAPQASEFADYVPNATGPVHISPNYDISGLTPKGKEKNLSKGQAHALGLSYVSACRQITSSDTFLFIDSPLHNISGDSRNEVAEVLSKHLPNVQIVLFVTDTEYTSGDEEGAKPVRAYLNPQTKVWKEWMIHVTCINCKDEILVKSKTNEKELVCNNCHRKYHVKNDPTGPRIIREYKRDV